ncbi:MAG: THUMP domain-containing protein [Planctomycetota bacterium]|nr:THUMP domain-containing protein [Planctomycetota bacterium]
MEERHYFAACGRGLEPAVAGELRELGAQHVEERRGGVAFHGDRRMGYLANLWLRAAIRVQEELLRAEVRDPNDLYEAVATVDWCRYIRPDQTLAVYASTRDTEELRHSGFAALRAKDAIVDVVRQEHSRRPSVDTRDPDVPLKLIVQRDKLLLYRDLSGASLHKRGWRPIQVKSPLNEATAAGLLLLSGWDRETPLCDPMCGSGTFLVEAAMLATNRAPGLHRYFAFERWDDHDARLWEQLREEARDQALFELDVPLMGADRHEGAISLAMKGAYDADVDQLISLTVIDAARWKPPTMPGFVVTNPPYGERIGRDEDLVDSWRTLGDFLKRACAGATAWVLSGNPELTRHLGLRASVRIPVKNGPIDCRWIRYEVRD